MLFWYAREKSKFVKAQHTQYKNIYKFSCTVTSVHAFQQVDFGPEHFWPDNFQTKLQFKAPWNFVIRRLSKLIC